MKTKIYFQPWILLCFCLIQNLGAQTIDNPVSNESSRQIRMKLGTADKIHAQKETGYAQLQQLAINMELQAAAMRKEAKNDPANTTKLMDEADNLEKLALQLQLEAFETSGKLNLEHFRLNRLAIRALLIRSSFDDAVYIPVMQLVNDSERNMKLATEMREEANAEKRAGVKLARLSNADEREVVALHEQDKAIAILNKYKSLTLGSR